jgi:hypothetical protein
MLCFANFRRFVATQAGMATLSFIKKYLRASLQNGQFLCGTTFSSAFVKDAFILDLFSSSVNKFIPKFSKLLPPSTQG